MASDSQRARELQHESIVGDAPGSSMREPAGMIISRPLRVACGSGEPQRRQNDVEKLRASGRSKRTTSFSPDGQRKAWGRTYAFAAKALPVAFRHREQWHFTNLRNGRSASNSIDRQRHPPRTTMFRSPSSGVCDVTFVGRPEAIKCWSCRAAVPLLRSPYPFGRWSALDTCIERDRIRRQAPSVAPCEPQSLVSQCVAPCPC
jgi:hypothetical protein